MGMLICVVACQSGCADVLGCVSVGMLCVGVCQCGHADVCRGMSVWVC